MKTEQKPQIISEIEMRRQQMMMAAQTQEEYEAAKLWYPKDCEDRHWGNMATHLERFI